MDSHDYRNTAYCPHLSGVADSKRKLEAEIKATHPNAGIHYNIVRKKDCNEYLEFVSIYNRKCAYCGASDDIIHNSLFEIDHINCKKSFENSTEGKAKAGRIENLALACFNCNRSKSSLDLLNNERVDLHPDHREIGNVFLRAKDYSIEIAPQYADDPHVLHVYKQMKYAAQFRRLDYLLLEMVRLSDFFENSGMARHKKKMDELIGLLLRKRNKIGKS